MSRCQPGHGHRRYVKQSFTSDPSADEERRAAAVAHVSYLGLHSEGLWRMLPPVLAVIDEDEPESGPQDVRAQASPTTTSTTPARTTTSTRSPRRFSVHPRCRSAAEPLAHLPGLVSTAPNVPSDMRSLRACGHARSLAASAAQPHQRERRRRRGVPSQRLQAAVPRPRLRAHPLHPV